MIKKVVFLVLVVAGATLTEKLPSTFKKCKRDDPNFESCLKDAIQDALVKLEDGVPSLNIPPIHPIVTPTVVIGEGKGAVHVVQDYKNFTVYNFGKGTIGPFSAKITPTGLNLKFTADYSSLKVEADYKFDGKILALPIYGNGKAHYLFEPLHCDIEMDAETYDKKGVKYLKIKHLKVSLRPEHLSIKLENLFDGNVELGDGLNKVLNENWLEFYNDVGGSIDNTFEIILQNYGNNVLSKIPYDELF